jgi:hypothetical protein
VSRRGLGYRIGQWACWTIGVETLGGLAYQAIRAGSVITVLLLLALAGIAWKGNHRRRRRR